MKQCRSESWATAVPWALGGKGAAEVLRGVDYPSRIQSQAA